MSLNYNYLSILRTTATRLARINIASVPATQDEQLCMRRRMPTEEDLINYFFSANQKKLAVLCGEISGNLEAIQLNLKNDFSGDLYRMFKEQIDPKIWVKFVVQQTPTGMQFIYRTLGITESAVLCQRPATDMERLLEKNATNKILVETKGEKDFIIIAPSKGYEFTQGDMASVVEVGKGERIHVMTRIKRFDTTNLFANPQVDAELYKLLDPDSVKKVWEITPVQDYNQRGNVRELLQKHGWVLTDAGIGELHGMMNFMRTSKDKVEKLSFNQNPSVNRLFCWTASTLFEPEQAYSRFDVFRILEHFGDMTTAFKDIKKAGYGKRAYEKWERGVYKDFLWGTPKWMLPDKTADMRWQRGTLKISPDHEDPHRPSAHLPLQTFWKVTLHTTTYKEKRGSQSPVRTLHTCEAKIVEKKLISWLHDVGVRTYKEQLHDHYYLREQQHLIEVISLMDIKRLVFDYVDSLPDYFDHIKRDDLIDLLFQERDRLFCDELLELLPAFNGTILRDTKKACYFSFKNGVLKITKDREEMLPYDVVGEKVWKGVIKNHIHG